MILASFLEDKPVEREHIGPGCVLAPVKAATVKEADIRPLTWLLNLFGVCETFSHCTVPAFTRILGSTERQLFTRAHA